MMTIDEKAIESLGLASELAHKVIAGEEGMSSPTASPVFAWLVRDFSL